MAGPRLTLAILLVLSALSQIDRAIISLMVAPISRDLGVGDVQIGFLQGFAFALFYAAFGLPFGLVADRWSRRWLIFAGVMVWSAAAAACGLAQSFGALLVARFFVGAGEAALMPAAFSLISDLFPKRKLAGAIAVFSIGASLGAGVSLGLGGRVVDLVLAGDVTLPLVGTVRPWQAVFLITGVPGLGLAFLSLLIREPDRGPRNAAASSWRALAQFIAGRRALFGCHFAAFALLGMLAYGGAAWIPTLMIRRFGLTAGQAGSAYGLVAFAATLIGMPAAGAAIDALMRRGVSDAVFRLFVWSIPLTIAAAAAACFSPSLAGFLFCLWFAQAGLNLGGPAATALQLVSPPEMRGRVSALYILVFNLVGYGLGPVVMAWLTVHVFKDPMAVHLSLATAFLVLAPVAWLLFIAGLRPLREAMAGT